MSRIEQTKREKRIEFLINRLTDMADDVDNNRVGDAIRADYVAQSRRFLQELKDYGVQFETPPAIISLTASKTGISATATARAERLANEQAATAPANLGAKEQLAKLRK